MRDPKPGPGVFVMTQFVVTPAPSAAARFEGDFTVAAAPGQAPTPQETECLDVIKTLLDDFASEENSDAGSNIPDALRTNRRALRKEIALKLQADITGLNSGALLVSGAKENAKSLQKKYDEVQTFGLRDKAPPSIEGEFELVYVPNYSPSGDERTIWITSHACFPS